MLNNNKMWVQLVADIRKCQQTLFSQKARVFDPAKALQPSLIFVSKEKVYASGASLGANI